MGNRHNHKKFIRNQANKGIKTHLSKYFANKLQSNLQWQVDNQILDPSLEHKHL